MNAVSALTQIIEHFHWLRPFWLLLLPLVGVMVYVLIRSRARNAAASELVAPHLAKHLFVAARRSRFFNPINALLLAVCLTAVALAGPSWQQQSSPLTEDEAVLVIALDVSASMLQTDIQPSRLERAKQKIQDLLTLRAGARTGLIVFSGTAHSVIPLTNDQDLISHFLNAVEPEMMPRKGKASSKVLHLAETMLSEALAGRNDIPGTLLLITDAADSSAHDAFETYFEQNQHQLLVWGIGSVNAEQQGGTLNLDSESLDRLADKADGHYQEFSVDKRDVRRINWRIENHLVFVEDDARPWQDMGYYLIWPLMLINVLWFRRGWATPSRRVENGTEMHAVTLSIALVAIFLMTTVPQANAQTHDIPSPPTSQHTVVPDREPPLQQLFLDLWFTRNQQGRYHFEQGNFRKAATLFTDPMLRGVSLYIAEDFDEAAAVFAGIDSNTGLFNQANALAHGRHYVKAVRAYTELLSRAPKHAGAARNRRVIQALIDANNRMSESQRAESGELELNQNLEEQPQSGDGADQITWQDRLPQTLSAEQILTDERIQQQWMKQVQQDPTRFLAVKFQMQANNSTSANNSQSDQQIENANE